mmetsp:Transcript_27384/g.46592  ORF Transcript_27384/g.46592 Transcript_27384/m.46592 type:complete len:238 (+) Transcript_27384:344-1057(+)
MQRVRRVPKSMLHFMICSRPSNPRRRRARRVVTRRSKPLLKSTRSKPWMESNAIASSGVRLAVPSSWLDWETLHRAPLNFTMLIPKPLSSKNITVPTKSSGIPPVVLSPPPSPNPSAEVTSNLPWTMVMSFGPSRASNSPKPHSRPFINSNGVPVRSSVPRLKSRRSLKTSKSTRRNSMRLMRRRNVDCDWRRRRASERVEPSLGPPWHVLRNGGRGKSRREWICSVGIIVTMRIIM